MAAVWFVTVAIGGPARHRPMVYPVGKREVSPLGDELRVLTLNLAHGRGNTVVQRMVPRKKALANLETVARLIDRHSPHVVAFQEADVNAFWSGRFNHIQHIASRADMCRFTHGSSVQGFGLSYGTGLVASTDMRHPFAGTFAPSPPTFPKGWVAGLVPWDASPTGYVCVVSTHLDFSRKASRRRQFAQLADTFGKVSHPLVIMGDFNCEIRTEPAMQKLLGTLDLQAYRADAPLGMTFPTSGKRLDWILVSRALRFVRYDVIEEPVSDHYAVSAVIGVGEDDLSAQ